METIDCRDLKTGTTEDKSISIFNCNTIQMNSTIHKLSFCASRILGIVYWFIAWMPARPVLKRNRAGLFEMFFTAYELFSFRLFTLKSKGQIIYQQQISLKKSQNWHFSSGFGQPKKTNWSPKNATSIRLTQMTTRNVLSQVIKKTRRERNENGKRKKKPKRTFWFSNRIF